MTMSAPDPLGTPPIAPKATMAKLVFGRLTDAWKGEAADFTPLLAAQLDALGEAIGVDLTSLGQSEVPSAGGRRIDIVAQVEDGSEFVVENQYGRADRGVAVWLVEAKAVRIDESKWAPLFAAVVEPNVFTASVEKAKQSESPKSVEDFLSQVGSAPLGDAIEMVMAQWSAVGHKRRFGPNHVVLEARGPSTGAYGPSWLSSTTGR